MKIYIASDHAGFIYKKDIVKELRYEGFDVVDMGPLTMNPDDDYPDFIEPLARRVAIDSNAFGIVIGGSGQGEAIVSNRVSGVRAIVYASQNPSIITAGREHNNANVLSVGSRFVSLEEALSAVFLFLRTPFFGAERHNRRIDKIDRKNAVREKITPAILAYSKEEIITQERKFRHLFPFVHIDITDGVFAGKKSWPLNIPSYKQSSDVGEVFDSLKKGFEIDLMVENPERMVPFLLKTEGKRIIFHLGSSETLKECVERSKKKGWEVYIALHIGDNPSSIEGYKELLDGIVCMGISPVGVQGSELNEKVYTLIHQTRELFPTIPITVDGGVKIWNVRSLFLQGIERAVVGSAMSNGDVESYKEAFQRCLVFQAT